MKQQRWVWVLVLAIVVAVAAPAMAGKGHKCTASTQDCLNKMAQKMKHKGWVGIEMDKAKPEGALLITRVVSDSPAERAGLKKGDVLLALNGIKFGDDDEAKKKKMKSAMKPGQQITYLVARDGHKKEIAVTLGTVPEAVMAEWVGHHMLEHATVEVAKN